MGNRARTRAMSSIDEYARGKLARLDSLGLRRSLVSTDRPDAVHANRDGKALVSFCCNDYLNLSHYPDVMAAARDAIERYGTGSGGSRLISGNVPLYEALEAKLAGLSVDEQQQQQEKQQQQMSNGDAEAGNEDGKVRTSLNSSTRAQGGLDQTLNISSLMVYTIPTENIFSIGKVSSLSGKKNVACCEMIVAERENRCACIFKCFAFPSFFDNINVKII